MLMLRLSVLFSVSNLLPKRPVTFTAQTSLCIILYSMHNNYNIY